MFPIAIDHGKSLAAMIKAGKYERVDGNITASNFPVVPGPRAGSIELLHPNPKMTARQMSAELERQGLRPATLPELLAFGARYPEKQREFPIIALGSVWRRCIDVSLASFLWGTLQWRGLHLSWLDLRWGEHCRFAAVRK